MSGSLTGTRDALILGSVGALIVLGCALRFWRLADLGFWYDELWAVVGATDRPLREIYREWMLGDSHPPGFFLANFLWFKIAPATELWARLPHALASTATVLYVAVGARRVLARDERVLAAAFLSLCYLSVHYALEVKQYSWMLLLATIATVAYLEIITTRTVSRANGLLLGVSTVGVAWLDYFAAVYAGLLLLLLTLIPYRESGAWRSILRVDLVFGILYLPIVPFLYYQLRYAPGGWQQPDLPRFVPDLLASLFFDNRVWVGIALSILAGSLALAAIARPEVRTMLRADRTRQLLVLSIGMSGILATLGVWQPVFFPRYFLVTFPAFFLLLGITVAAVFPIRHGWPAVVPLVFFIQAAVVQVHAVGAIRHQEWDKSVSLVLERMDPGDRVFVLGADDDRTSFDYLKEGDVDGVFYVKNISFYEYYFERRGAAAVAAQLEVVEPTVEAVEALARRFRGTGTTVYVLAGHHIAFSPGALAVLTRVCSGVETSELLSTLVYTLEFSRERR